MARYSISVNNVTKTVDVDADTPLLWVLRDHLKMPGTKFGCGAGLCGACTVHLNGKAVRSCSYPISAVKEAKVTTIEGLASNPDNPVIQAWIDVEAPQCGYCQPGQIMAAAALLSEDPEIPEDKIRERQTNLCRCGAYSKIFEAINQAAESMRKG